MKRRDLIKRCQQLASDAGHTFEPLREGGQHTVFVVNGQQIPIPRHREIKEGLARGVQKMVQEALEAQ